MENQEKKLDRRVVKTKRAIRNAFAELLTQKDINEITIKDIADTADINRKTFYNYYSGIHQVVDEIEDEIISALNELVGEIDFRRDLEDPYHLYAKITATINNDIDFYSRLMTVNSNANLVTKIIDALKEKVKASFSAQISIDSETLDIMTEYVFSGMLAVYRNWFNSSRESSMEDISRKVSMLISAGINGILKDSAVRAE